MINPPSGGGSYVDLTGPKNVPINQDIYIGPEPGPTSGVWIRADCFRRVQDWQVTHPGEPIPLELFGIIPD